MINSFLRSCFNHWFGHGAQQPTIIKKKKKTQVEKLKVEKEKFQMGKDGKFSKK